MTSVTNDVSLGRQALRRSVNGRIRGVASGSEGTIEVFCECGRVRCANRLHIAVDTYDEVLGLPGRYVVKADHENDAAERVVARHDGYVLVERAAPVPDSTR